MKTRTILLGLSIVTLAAAGCRKGDGAASASASEVLDVWKAAGLSPGEFRDLEPGPAGGECQRGAVEGIEATLCAYADEAAAKKAEEAGLELVGEATGTVILSGRMLVVLADRQNVDPNGKRINSLQKALRR